MRLSTDRLNELMQEVNIEDAEVLTKLAQGEESPQEFKNKSIRKAFIERVIKELTSCSDGKYITEIYAKPGSMDHTGEFTNWVGLMIETDPEFVNESLYDLINNIEERAYLSYAFTLVISVEPDTVERGHGTVLWKRRQ